MKFLRPGDMDEGEPSDPMNDTCILHPDVPSTDHMNVPCAPGGKVGICAACKKRLDAGDRAFITESFNAYRASHHSEKGQRIAAFKREN